MVAAHVVVAIGMCGLTSCKRPAPENSAHAYSSSSPVPPANSGPNTAPSRDLRGDEAAGGHILRKHVGQSDGELRERLERERNITGASTYSDRAAAEQTVGAAIAQSQERIQNWLKRAGGHPNLVLNYDSQSPIGRTINRGESQSHLCSHALVVLKYTGPNDYYVLTSYPECR
jgi:hypothetical protein